ncbi:TPA: hypothetical protein N0F65_000333 [Lagenidium giganteum]|uniref:RNB domain-containing protein n=1 Tax=Lagenidium giganteum TaxID=4803 RepID=A0AAV2YPD0_9STRA|nr:TPA: hypothetical protein N0F65_000333 [Lagenidium giganteum]
MDGATTAARVDVATGPGKERRRTRSNGNEDGAAPTSTRREKSSQQTRNQLKSARTKTAPALQQQQQQRMTTEPTVEKKQDPQETQAQPARKKKAGNKKPTEKPKDSGEVVVVLKVAETGKRKKWRAKRSELVTVEIETSDEEAEDSVRQVKCVAQRVQVLDTDEAVDEATIVGDEVVKDKDAKHKKSAKKKKQKQKKQQQQQQQYSAAEEEDASDVQRADAEDSATKQRKQKAVKADNDAVQQQNRAPATSRRRKSIEKAPKKKERDSMAAVPNNQQKKTEAAQQPATQQGKKSKPKRKESEEAAQQLSSHQGPTTKPKRKESEAEAAQHPSSQQVKKSKPKRKESPDIVSTGPDSGKENQATRTRRERNSNKKEPQQLPINTDAQKGIETPTNPKETKSQQKKKSARSKREEKIASDKEDDQTTNKTTKKLNERTADDSNNSRSKRSNREAVTYEEYLSQELTMQKLEEGKLFQGKLRVNPQYRNNGWVTVDGVSADILIEGMSHRNRAMDNDLVAVELLPESEWKQLNAEDDRAEVKLRPNLSPTASADTQVLTSLWRPNVNAEKCFIKKQASHDSTSSSNPLKSASSVVNQAILTKKLRPVGKVVFVLASGNEHGFVGQLEPKTRVTSMDEPLPPQDDYAYFNAQDLRLPRRIRIPRLQLPDEFVQRPLAYSLQMMCFCRIKTWSTGHNAPKGEFIKTLGEYTGIESGISAILMQFGLTSHAIDFSSLILDELDAKYGVSGDQWEISAEEIAKRRDFRKYQIFSIDPYNARDLDDALHVRALDPEGKAFEIGVHIADVTHFMEEGSLLDKEAQERATSVYFVNRVLPMLPRVLCEKLCSLQPRVDRLAFSVVWQMNSDGTLVENTTPWYGKSIIRSCCKLDYGSAQMMLDGHITADNIAKWEVDRRPTGENPDITCSTVIEAVRNLWKIGKERRAMRFATGAISLNDVKITFKLDANGNPDQFGTYEQKDSNHLVEEYMLLANYLVAQRLLQFHGPLAFIRHHPPPVDNSLQQALALLSENHVDIDGSSAKSLSDTLEKTHELHGDTMYTVAQALLIKPMKPAEYMVAGNGHSPEAWRHYALNIPYYTHFTSPIRRYADVVVHRLLQESVILTEEEAEMDDETRSKRLQEFSNVASNCNEKKMTAKKSEKACDLLFLCAYVKHKGEVVVRGAVIGFGKQSFTVHLMDLGIEHRVFVKDLKGSTAEWNEATKQLTLRMSVKKRKSKGRKKAVSSTAEDEDEVAAVLTQDDDGGGEEQTMPTANEQADNASVRIPLTFAKMLAFRLKVTQKMPMELVYQLVGEAK